MSFHFTIVYHTVLVSKTGDKIVAQMLVFTLYCTLRIVNISLMKKVKNKMGLPLSVFFCDVVNDNTVGAVFQEKE